MKILLDTGACTGHGRCYALSPHAFTPDEIGHCDIVVAEPTPEQEAQARIAVASCPEEALRIDDAPRIGDSAG